MNQFFWYKTSSEAVAGLFLDAEKKKKLNEKNMKNALYFSKKKAAAAVVIRIVVQSSKLGLLLLPSRWLSTLARSPPTGHHETYIHFWSTR